MSEFQLILSIVALGIFVIFFKQLFSGNYPKRGVDYEAKVDNSQIGGISTPTKVFKNEQKAVEPSRVEQLFGMAQEALESGDNIEAKKALQSLLILEPKNSDAMRMMAVANMNMNDFSSAKEILQEALSIDDSDDLAHTLLANALHKLAEDNQAILHHKKAIELDGTYAKHYFNYANTLLDIGQKDEAIAMYKKAIELDSSLQEAKKILSELENEHN
jgi:tetratricopeptide (TPR) repeat protein